MKGNQAARKKVKVEAKLGPFRVNSNFFRELKVSMPTNIYSSLPITDVMFLTPSLCERPSLSSTHKFMHPPHLHKFMKIGRIIIKKHFESKGFISNYRLCTPYITFQIINALNH